MPLNEVRGGGNHNGPRIVRLYDLGGNDIPSGQPCRACPVMPGEDFIASLRGRGPDDDPHQQSHLLQLLRKGFQLCGRIRLETDIRRGERDPLAASGQRRPQVQGCGSLAYAALLVCYRKNSM